MWNAKSPEAYISNVLFAKPFTKTCCIWSMNLLGSVSSRPFESRKDWLVAGFHSTKQFLAGQCG